MKSKRIGPVVAPFLFLALASTALAGLPDPGMQVDAKTALVITDPQNDFLSPKGVTWGERHRQQHGADWLARYNKYINDGKTVVTSPHKVYGPESNDLALQLRKRGIERVILAGMSANLCVESHLRELLEQGFEVAVVKDATAAAIVPEGDGYAAALTNFRFLASAVWTTNEAKAAMQKLLASK